MRVEVVEPSRTRELRRTVLRPGLAPEAPLPGDDLPDAVHLAAIEDGAALSTCFVFPEPCPWRADAPAWHLRQMATVDSARSRGYGGAVLDAAIELVGERGGRLLWCNVREVAVPFYRRHGLETFGDVFTDEQHPIPHLRMSRMIGAGT